jgi:catechol 2,3-dioxygenase-like lactoylglutathione lyase family enzyme
MSRVQLALNVDNMDDAVDFYRTLFRTEPAKRRPDYANFVIADPPLKLVLISGGGHVPGGLNHLGVEVESTDEVAAARERLVSDDLLTSTEDGVTCCFAVQDKVWATSPDGVPWEIYTVLADADAMGAEPVEGKSAGSDCCGGQPEGTTGTATGATSPSASCC